MRVTSSLLAIFLSALSTEAVLAQAEPTVAPLILRVHIADRAADIPRLAAMQLDLAGIDVKRDTVDFVGDRETQQALQERGFFPEIVAGGEQRGMIDALSQYLDPEEISEKLETYVGGIAKNRAYGAIPEKQIVMALVERGGAVRSFHVPNVTAHVLAPIIGSTRIAKAT